ncbi:hypothetical protein VTN00DRAFT_7796 [Thermoascus crustaceus]|uniref:uncharacterized protein n=1 Tax=Thermoascus crustaceus TaxID=5088 RepID=UPI003742CB89
MDDWARWACRALKPKKGQSHPRRIFDLTMTRWTTTLQAPACLVINQEHGSLASSTPSPGRCPSRHFSQFQPVAHLSLLLPPLEDIFRLPFRKVACCHQALLYLFEDVLLVACCAAFVGAKYKNRFRLITITDRIILVSLNTSVPSHKTLVLEFAIHTIGSFFC